jgi:hypothetical protein
MSWEYCYYSMGPEAGLIAVDEAFARYGAELAFLHGPPRGHPDRYVTGVIGRGAAGLG